jgi:6-phosphogluconolactonase/glucosamine-6-phosphate isomerase/deaminase
MPPVNRPSHTGLRTGGMKITRNSSRVKRLLQKGRFGMAVLRTGDDTVGDVRQQLYRAQVCPGYPIDAALLGIGRDGHNGTSGPPS